MDSQRSVKTEEGGWIVKSENTALGKEVGLDEINWWVFKKEADIEALRKRTESALKAVQVLKQAAVTLQNQSPLTYIGLLATLRQFAEDHSQEIEALHKYVCWLHARELMAPHILFTYRVWGSTRMSDRWLGLDKKSLRDVEAKIEDARELARLVLGLRDHILHTFVRASFDIQEEVYNSIDPDAGIEEIEIPESRVIQRAARLAYDKCATYFEYIPKLTQKHLT